MHIDKERKKKEEKLITDWIRGLTYKKLMQEHGLSKNKLIWNLKVGFKNLCDASDLCLSNNEFEMLFNKVNKDRKSVVNRKMIENQSRTNLYNRSMKILYFWLNGRTYENIGKTFGLTRQRIEQIVKKALFNKYLILLNEGKTNISFDLFLRKTKKRRLHYIDKINLK